MICGSESVSNIKIYMDWCVVFTHAFGFLLFLVIVGEADLTLKS